MVLNIADALSAYRQGGGGASPASVAGDSSGESSGVGSFGETLKGFMGDTIDKLQKSDEAAAASATGKGDLAGIVIAIGDAEQMLQTVVTIRDKVIAAYQDISKTAI